MKSRKIQSTRYTSGGYYIIERIGQQNPCEGDGVIVSCTIHFAVAHGPRLDEAIAFGDRIQVADQPLWSSWGALNAEKRTRFITKQFTAETWAAAFEAAHRWADGELLNLDHAIAARAQALADAES